MLYSTLTVPVSPTDKNLYHLCILLQVRQYGAEDDSQCLQTFLATDYTQ